MRIIEHFVELMQVTVGCHTWTWAGFGQSIEISSACHAAIVDIYLHVVYLYLFARNVGSPTDF